MFLSNKSRQPTNLCSQSNPEKIDKLKKTTLQTTRLNKNPSLFEAQAYCRIYINILR